MITNDMLLTNRKSIRRVWHQIVSASIDVVPIDNIKRSRLTDPKGTSPLIYITSGGSKRPPMTVRQKSVEFLITMYSLVLLTDANNKLWTEEMAEDLIDDIEAQVKSAVEANPKKEGLWTSLEYIDDGTLVERASMYGNEYLVEMIPLIFKNSF